MKTAYELRDGEIIYTPTGEKVATWDGEKHRMARGFADEHAESIAAWVSLNLQLGPAVPVGTEPKPDPVPFDIPAPGEAPAARPPTKVIPPKPAGFPDGEKAPEVVAWIDKYGSPEEKVRLASWRARGLTLNGESNEKALIPTQA